MSVAEMRMLRWISENTWKDRIWNEEIYLKIGVAPIDENMRKNHLRWFDHVQRRTINTPIRKWVDLSWGSKRKKSRTRPKITLVEIIKKWIIN